MVMPTSEQAEYKVVIYRRSLQTNKEAWFPQLTKFLTLQQQIYTNSLVMILTRVILSA